MESASLATDAAILRRLNQGQEMAFEYFFHRFFPLMFVYAQRLINNPELAKEVVQDVFFKVWEKHNDFKDVRALKAFLYVATKNAAFNALDKLTNRQKHYGLYASHINEADQHTVIHEIIRSELYASLSSAIATLPEQCRKIIQMIFEEDMQPSEIADKLGISVSTVNSQKSRGLMLLKQRLNPKDLSLVLFLLSINLFHK